ncbi:protein root primordium defective 1, partial [Tanacetum coccineum]
SVSVDSLNRLSQKLHLNRGATAFLRKYPRIFEIFYDASLSQPFCKLTPAAIQISHEESEAIHSDHPLVIDRLVRLLSMSLSKTLPLRAIFKVWRELGLPDDFEDSVISKNPQLFQVLDAHEPNTHLIKLVGKIPGHEHFTAAVENWRVVECCKDDCSVDRMEMRFRFKHGYPPCMKLKKNFRAKVKEWQKVPYAKLEFLILTVRGRTVEVVEDLRHLRTRFGIDFNLRDLFLDHPGMFNFRHKGKRQILCYVVEEAYRAWMFWFIQTLVYVGVREHLNLGYWWEDAGFAFLCDYKLLLQVRSEEEVRWINHFYETPNREWFETDAVLRVTLGNFLFFLPNEVISFYESTSKIGSGLFLLVQVVLLLDFVHSWNDEWVSYDEQFWYAALLVVSLVCYLATFFFSGVLFYLFTPSGEDRGLNTFFMVMTLILVFVFAIITLHPTVSGSILPASVISLYCMYLCYSGLASVISSAGGEKPLLPLDKRDEHDEKENSKPVSYSYSFHIFFSLASMYSAVLLTGW